MNIKYDFDEPNEIKTNHPNKQINKIILQMLGFEIFSDIIRLDTAALKRPDMTPEMAQVHYNEAMVIIEKIHTLIEEGKIVSRAENHV